MIKALLRPLMIFIPFALGLCFPAAYVLAGPPWNVIRYTLMVMVFNSCLQIRLAELRVRREHLLLAAVAPRRLLIEGYDSPWFDTEGEYLACKAASPVWELLGKKGLPEGPFPEDFDASLIGEDLGYYHRAEEHGLAAFDWWQLMRFTQR